METKDQAGKVYVVHNEWIRSPGPDGAMPYKIGITKKAVSERFYGLNLVMPGEFVWDFVYEFDTGYDRVETALHEILSEKSVGGEWFEIDGETLEMVRQICKVRGGKEVTEIVAEDTAADIEALQEDDAESSNDVDPDDLERIERLERIVTRWNETSDMKAAGGSTFRKRIRIPDANVSGLFYRFIIKDVKKVYLDLHCTGSALVDVLGGFDGLKINGCVFTFKKNTEKDNLLKARLYTWVPWTESVDAVVEVMRLLIEATKEKVVEAYKSIKA
ncbi:hypothetical protein R80B4_01686 [Fibrobacteres bacterium R8-0-B4]